jgi:hypothetical protein
MLEIPRGTRTRNRQLGVGARREEVSGPTQQLGSDGTGREVPVAASSPPPRIFAIEDPELRAAFMAAHRGWAKRYAPQLLQEWVNG